jgi:predicted naringenin-chalcone synthase
MTAWIHRLDTLVPDFSFSQDDASEKMQAWARDERERRLVRAVYRNSGIERRHSVLRNYDGEGEGAFFRRGPDGVLVGPGTAARNAIFADASRDMSVRLARKTLENARGFLPAEITHVVTVSCTGFYNPGPDYFIVRELGLSEATQRYHLGFMGCYAAIPALRMAAQFCEADPGAVVLVMCLELCTLHLQLTGSEDNLLANSLFADGAAAAVVAARRPEPGVPALKLGSFRSALVPGGERDMAWSIGDRGFDIALSSYVPKLIAGNIAALVAPALDAAGLSLPGIGRWAVHPGGKAIIDQVQRSLGLSAEQVRASRGVLRRYGNMSSATILFVLDQLLHEPSAEPEEQLCAVAFGPGLTVEMAALKAHRACPAAGAPA